MSDIEIRNNLKNRPARRRRPLPSLFSNAYGLSPFGMMRRMAEEMERAIGEGTDIFGDLESEWPAIDVYEDDNSLKVRADLPGVKPDDIKIEVSDGNLTLPDRENAILSGVFSFYFRCVFRSQNPQSGQHFSAVKNFSFID